MLALIKLFLLRVFLCLICSLGGGNAQFLDGKQRLAVGVYWRIKVCERNSSLEALGKKSLDRHTKTSLNFKTERQDRETRQRDKTSA